MQNLINLLSKLSISLNDKNKHNESTDSFNIFNVLGVQSKEVILCRFIGELLNPKGNHDLGTVPLKLFFRYVLKEELSDEEAQKATVVLEDKIDDNRRVDIAIFIGNKVFPIEAKVWAIDQNAQLYDYYIYYQKEGCNINRIYYLTPNGKLPSNESIRNLSLEKVICISFEKDILYWIRNIKIDYECNLKSILKQFEEVILNMNYENEMSQTVSEVLNLDDIDNYTSNDLLKSAVELLNCKDGIVDSIMIGYLKSKLSFDKDKYQLSETTSEEKKGYDNALLKIINKTSSLPIAWICVGANLYILAERVKTEKGLWSEKSKANYYWQYLNPDGSNKTFPLKKLRCIFDNNREIDIQKYLEDIIYE